MMELKCSCDYCNNFISDSKCKAFDRIPDEILVGIEKHETPYPGDNGIMFEPIEENKNESS
jgi:hypothetical protein